MGSSSALVIPFVFYFAGTRLWRLVMDFLAVVLVLSLVASRSIFSLGVWSLSGYAALFPLVVGVLYWRRSTGAGAMAAILTIAVLWVVFLTRSLGVTGEYTVAGSGLMPVRGHVCRGLSELRLGVSGHPSARRRRRRQVLSILVS